MIQTRRQWLQAASIGLTCSGVCAARKDFWEAKDAAAWTSEEKQTLLRDSPWARWGYARIDQEKQTTLAYPNGAPMPDTRPGVPPAMAKSVPFGEPVPKPPKPASGPPIQFPVMARWETATPVRLAGGPDVAELAAQYYVIRLKGMPLMPAPKPKPGEPVPPDPNESLLPAIKSGTRLERAGKPPLACERLFTGSGDTALELLLLFPRAANPITLADKLLVLESRFAAFHLSVRFTLKDMRYKGELAL